MSFTQFDRTMYALRSAGYAVISDFVPDSLLSSAEEATGHFEAEIDDFVTRGGDLPYQAGWPLKNIRCLFAVNRVFQTMVMETGLMSFVNAYLGEGAKLRDLHFLVNNPDEFNSQKSLGDPVNWHRDKKWADNEEIIASYLHCFFLVTDMTAENGGTLIVPGTHKEREPGYYFLDNDHGMHVKGNYYKVYPQDYFPACTQVVAKRGSLVLIDPMTIHAQGINISSVKRSVLNATFHRSGIPGIIDCAHVARSHGRYPMSEAFVSILNAGTGSVRSYGSLA